MSPQSTFPPYVERSARFDGVHSFGDWSVKLYTIDGGGSASATALLGPALEKIPDLLPKDVAGGRAPTATDLAGDTGPVHGESFAILHAGEDAVWLLVFWWADRCLLHRRVVAARLTAPEDFALAASDTLVACTWELAVVAHERHAWVRTVQGAGPTADYHAYRSDVLPDGRV